MVELAPEEWCDLGHDTRIRCAPYDNGDSWLALRSGSQQLLNSNDCGMRDRRRLEKLKAELGAIDLLATQFSYAFWLGNEDEKSRREAYARQKLVDMKLQIDVLEPTFVMPIASFIRFCHKENHYLNDSINTARTTSDFIEQETSSQPIVLYPGDRWKLGAAHDNGSALGRYAADFDAVLSSRLEIRRPVAREVLFEHAEAFVRKLATSAGMARFLLAPAKVYMWDFDESYVLLPRDGLKLSQCKRQDCDIELSADSLLFCLKEPFGMDTLGINGRYRKTANGKYSRFYNLFRFGQLGSRGLQVGPSYLLQALWRKVAKRLTRTSPENG